MLITCIWGSYLSILSINNYTSSLSGDPHIPKWIESIYYVVFVVGLLCFILYSPIWIGIQWARLYSVWLVYTAISLAIFFLITSVRVFVLYHKFFGLVHICWAFTVFVHLLIINNQLANSASLDDSALWHQALSGYGQIGSLESLTVFLTPIIVITFLLPLKIITTKVITTYDPKEVEHAFDEKYKFLVVLDEDIDERKLIQCMTGIGFKYSPANDFGDSHTYRKHFSYFNGYGFIEASSLVKDTFVGSIEVYFTLQGSRSVAIKALSLLVTISEDLGAKVYDLEVYRERCQRSSGFLGRFLHSYSDEMGTDELCQVSLDFESFEQNALQIVKRKRFIEQWNNKQFKRFASKNYFSEH